jgi:predicted ribosome quality control (RQC) complex YloA/Tae2 family protein
MIQNYLSLQQSVNKYNQQTSAYAQVQKIYSTRTSLCISLRYPGITRYLYLGRGAGVEGIWEGKSFPESNLRCRDRLLEYFRRHLTSGLVSEIRLDELDRIIIIPYTKYGLQNYLMYFWNGRKSFLLHAFYPSIDHAFKVFTSWSGDISFGESENNLETLLSLFNQVGRTNIPKDQLLINLGQIQEILKKELEATAREKLISKKEKSLKKKLKFIHDDLAKVREWENLKKLTQKSDFSLEHDQEITIGSHKFKLQNLNGHHQKMGLIFEKIKKLQKAEKILELRKENTEEELKKVPESITEESEVKNLPGPKFEVQKNLSVIKSKNEWWEYKIGEKRFAIGKTAQGNDELRSIYASKEDWWLHLDQRESAHLVIKSDWHLLSQQEMQVLVSALAEYSKIAVEPDQLIPIIFTQVKYLKGVKGRSGLVIYKKEKHMSVLALFDWKKFVTPLFTH